MRAASQETPLWSILRKLWKASDGFCITARAAEEIYAGESTRDIGRFWSSLFERLDESYRWDVWAVGAILNGHVEVNFLEDYQLWILLQGLEFHEAVLRDPACAVERVSAEDPASSFSFRYLWTMASNVYIGRTGRDLPNLGEKRLLHSPSGTPWGWRDLAAMHPTLWNKFFVSRDRRPARPDLSKLGDYELMCYAARPLFCWVDIYGPIEYFLQQYGVLSPPQRMLHAVRWMKSEVDNGGYQQFFGNSTGIVAPEALEGLRYFGAEQHHEALSEIMAAFPGGAPSRDWSKRSAQMAERWDHTRIDNEFPGAEQAPALESAIAEHIRDHPDDFFGPA